MIHRIHKYPEAVLKRHAAPVKNIDGRLVQFLDDMAETMYAAPGVGLAAPQVGLSERAIVLDCDSDEDKEQGKGRGLLKLVNPEIVEADGAIVWEEGCLSVVDFTAEVNRAARVLVRAFTPEEKEVRIEAEGLWAVALQHEIDHLDGKLFIDRLSRLKRDLYKRKVRKMQKDGRFEEAAARGPAVHI
ncbi:MAG: peptide deformylase [Candidatus Binatia bacterium]